MPVQLPLCHPDSDTPSNGAASGASRQGRGEPTVQAIILAAGRSTRMHSDLVKVLHPVCRQPMLTWILDACRDAGCARLFVVVGHQGDQVRRAYADRDDVTFVTQAEQLGTGHAVAQVEPLLSDYEGDVVVLGGDGPLIQARTLRSLIDAHRTACAAATLATACIDDPTGYGRIIRNDVGQFVGIVEERDATDGQRLIREINPTYYCFQAPALFGALSKVECNNEKHEYYLTDVFAILLASGQPVHVVQTVDPSEVLSINTPEQLAHVSSILAERLRKERPT